MDINSIIKQNIYDIESQLNTDLSNKEFKPMIFIDNTNFNKIENPLAIVHLSIFDSKDVVVIKDNLKEEDAFSIVNLVGDKAVYCLWGMDYIDDVKSLLVECNYPISDKTIFLDLKETASSFYGKSIDTFEDVQNIVSYASESVDLIFSSKESIMYSLFIDMINNGYESCDLESTLEDIIKENEFACVDSIFKGREFRNSKSSIEFENSELINLELFASCMKEYNTQMEEYLNSKLKSNNLSEVHRMLLSEKTVMCRFKKDVYTYTIALLEANKKNDFDTYKFYYKTLDMYALMEDAFILSNELKEVNSFSNFVKDLGVVFSMSTSTYANTFLLRKNVLAKLNK